MKISLARFHFTKPLNSKGISHLVVPLGAVFLIAVVGSVTLLASHANPVPKLKPDTIIVKTYHQICNKSNDNCKLPGAPNAAPNAKSPVFVQSHSAGASCNGRPIHNGTINMGTSHRLRCAPGQYFIYLNNPAELLYDCYGTSPGEHDLGGGFCVTYKYAHVYVIGYGEKDTVTVGTANNR